MSKLNSSIVLGLATVSKNGLEFNGKFYTNATMLKFRWFEIAQIEGQWEIPIFFNPCDPTEIMLFDIDSITYANIIEPSRNLNPEMKQLYHDAINSLKKRLKESNKKL